MYHLGFLDTSNRKWLWLTKQKSYWVACRIVGRTEELGWRLSFLEQNPTPSLITGLTRKCHFWALDDTWLLLQDFKFITTAGPAITEAFFMSGTQLPPLLIQLHLSLPAPESTSHADLSGWQSQVMCLFLSYKGNWQSKYLVFFSSWGKQSCLV